MQTTDTAQEEIFQVRKLEISDKSKGFIQLLQQLTICDSISDQAFEERFHEITKNGDDRLICVIEDNNNNNPGKIVATGSVFIEKKFIRNCGKVGHIEDVVVDSSVRGKQLGKKITGFLCDHALAMGCYKVILDCSMENSQFYEKCGFKQKEIQMVKMESIFRLLLHEQTLVQGDHVDNRVRSSIDYHRRDPATTLETAKWQLEDFERAVNVAAIADKSQVKQNVIARHKQFIGAIREQITHVEQSMDTSVGNSLRNMNLNEQDRDGLALFLSGGKPVKHIAYNESENNDRLRRFLDTAMSSSSNEDIDKQKAGQTMSYNIANLDSNAELENFPKELDLGPSFSAQEANYGRYNEEGTWDLEANGKSYMQKSKLRSYYGRMNIFGSLGNFLSIYGSRARRSFTKRLKDGEEERQSPLGGDVHPSMQRYFAQVRQACRCSNSHLSFPQVSARVMQSYSCITGYIEECHRSLRRLQFRDHPILFVLAVFLTLIILSILVS